MASHDHIKRVVKTFLNEDEETFYQIQALVSQGKTRLIVSLYLFNNINSDFSSRLLADPFTFLPPCEEALQEICESAEAKTGDFSGIKKSQRKPRLGFTDWFGSHTVSPRGLSSRLVNRLVCVVGIVTRCSLVHPKLVASVKYVEETKKHSYRVHHDSMTITRDKDQNVLIPNLDADGHKYQVEIGLCEYKDFQRFTVQEMPESAPSGQLPRSVDVVVEEDLVDRIKPGDRVRVFGVYRCVASREGGKLSGFTRTFIVCNNVEQLKKDVQSPDINPAELRQIRNLAERDDAFDVLSRSVAPSISGHEMVKKGMLLQLLGGERKDLDNEGMRLRGDIHVLLIGDPSCGKSQLLRFMLNTAPLALSSTGRSSSGVGLTAAVTSDQDTGERRLEAGAMVLADMGVVCIDEFDKMSHEDRVAIHEVMEQQTVTICKAGIQTSLNARCSILAAANPLYGSFDESMDLKRQIAFPDSLLSRFDLTYVVRDSQTTEQDRAICSQVTKQLRFRPDSDLLLQSNETNRRGAAGAIIQPLVQQHEAEGDRAIWQTACDSRSGGAQSFVTVDFLRKFIFYCKHHRESPTLTDEAIEEISEFYAELRQRFVPKGGLQNRNFSIPTARTLEACIRLSTAHAKLKMRSHIQKDDVKRAKDLLLFTLCGEVSTETSSKKSKATRAEVASDEEGEDSSSESGSSDDDDIPLFEDEQTPTEGSRSRRKRERKRGSTEEDLLSALGEMSLERSTSTRNARVATLKRRRVEEGNETPTTTIATISQTRLKELMKHISAVHQSSGADSMRESDLLDGVNECVPVRSQRFDENEFRAGLAQLQEENRMMDVQGTVWFI